jgi:hypothetical protein
MIFPGDIVVSKIRPRPPAKLIVGLILFADSHAITCDVMWGTYISTIVLQSSLLKL